MKHFRFTIASDKNTGDIVVLATTKALVYPWPPHYWQAAYEVGRDCRCRKCHNCEIFELIANFRVSEYHE